MTANILPPLPIFVKRDGFLVGGRVGSAEDKGSDGYGHCIVRKAIVGVSGVFGKSRSAY
jgi:hypothetical protein